MNNEISKTEKCPAEANESSAELRVKQINNLELLVAGLDDHIATIIKMLYIRYHEHPEVLCLQALAVQAAALGSVVKCNNPITGDVHLDLPLMFIENDSRNASESLALLFEPIERFYGALGSGVSGVSREILKSNYDKLLDSYAEQNSEVEEDPAGTELFHSERRRMRLADHFAPKTKLLRLLMNPVFVNKLDPEFISRLLKESYDSFTTFAGFLPTDALSELRGISGESEGFLQMVSKKNRTRPAYSEPGGMSFNPVLNLICTAEKSSIATHMPYLMSESAGLAEVLVYIECADELPSFSADSHVSEKDGLVNWRSFIQGFLNLREEKVRIAGELDLEATKQFAVFSEKCFLEARQADVPAVKDFLRSAPRIALTLAASFRAAQKSGLSKGKTLIVGPKALEKAIFLTRWLRNQQVKAWQGLATMAPPPETTVIVEEEVIRMYRKLKISGPCSKRELFRKYNNQDYGALELTLEQAIEMKKVRVSDGRITVIEPCEAATACAELE